MIKLLGLILLLFVTYTSLAQADSTAYEKFNAFNNRVLAGHVKKAEARRSFKELAASIQNEFRRLGVHEQRDTWIFPLKGYSYRAAGGTNGNGYIDKGFRYLDGNRHGAHPAHDLFIKDANQDCIDDHTGKPVDVLAVSAGIVIACTNEWHQASALRGGRYIWTYHPGGYLTYYAHNRQIFAKPGDFVQQGQKIAEVGRTGFNAYKKRSPTHLHFSAFKLVNDLPIPYNPYPQLKQALSK